MARRADSGERYWRTFERKLGEDLDLAGKALSAAAAAGVLAPLAANGVIGLPTPTVGGISVFGVLFIAVGIHLQARAKPDE